MVSPALAGVVLVVGAGSIGQRHAANLAALGARVELLTWRRFNAAELAQRHDIAALVIATATPIRLELIQLCGERGWPVYAEKPLAWRQEQLQAIEAAAGPVAQRSLVGFMLRYHPAVRALAALNLGDLYRFEAEIGHDVRQWRPNWRFSQSYAAAAEGGGVLLDLSHELDLVSALVPGLTVRDVRCLGHTAFPGVDFATSMQLTAASGAAGTVALDYLAPVSIRRLTLCGQDRRIEVNLLSGELRQSGPDGDETRTYPLERNQLFLDAMAEFLQLAAGGDLPDDPLRPVFARMGSSSRLIASAWEQRQFSGAVALPID
ncbi:MAG: Gfo/Idh/MocA family protein [Cyanobacteriota bacterium]